MKKIVPILLFLSVFITMFSGIGVGQAKAAAVTPKLYLNGQLLQSDVAPQIVDGKYTMVPIRIVSESIGYDVKWAKETQTVTIHNGTDEIILKIDDKNALINNKTVAMDKSALLQKGTTLIPLRFVGEQLGLTVKWDDDTKSVYLIHIPVEPVEPEEPAATVPPVTDVSTGLLTSIQYDSIDGILLTYDGTVVPNKPFKLDNPKRIVIDLPNTGYSNVLAGQFTGAETKLPVTDNPYLKTIRYSLFSTNPSTVRLVLDLAADADAELIEGTGELRIYVNEVSTVPVDPVTPPVTEPPATGGKVYSIMIDAGHGGTDPGTSGSGRFEKEFNLSVALKVKALLDKEPYLKPLMTRSDDTYITLANRVKLAEANKVDLFLSIHGNSSTVPGPNGTETYYSRDSSKAFADIVHKHLLKATGLKDRGVKKASLHVTRETTMPAILLESGFLDSSDVKVLFDDAVQNRIATEIVAGIKEYLKLS